MGFAEDRPIPLVDEGLGNSAHLLDLGDGRLTHQIREALSVLGVTAPR